MKKNLKDKYDRPSCPECGEFKTIVTCRALNYLFHKQVIDFKCLQNHEWSITEQYPEVFKDPLEMLY